MSIVERERGAAVRRKEFEVAEKSRMEEVLRRADIGYLAFNGTDGWPRLTALNYAYDGRSFGTGRGRGALRVLEKGSSCKFFCRVPAGLSAVALSIRGKRDRILRGFQVGRGAGDMPVH